MTLIIQPYVLYGADHAPYIDCIRTSESNVLEDARAKLLGHLAVHNRRRTIDG